MRNYKGRRVSRTSSPVPVFNSSDGTRQWARVSLRVLPTRRVSAYLGWDSMLIECDNCGAPLDVKEGASTSKCRYCGKTSRVKSLRTVALETPKDWRPPQTWTPPDHMPAPHAPLAYHPPAAARKVVALTGSLTGLITMATIGWVAYQATRAPLDALKNSETLNTQIKDTVAQVTKQLGGVAAVAGSVTPPVVCSGNERYTVTQKVIALPSGTPVVASGNCQVTLQSCTVTGTTAIVASDNARIAVEGGTLTGTAAAVKASGNAVVTLSASAFVSGEPALTATNNAKIELVGATAQGRTVAATASHNATVDATRGTLQGKVSGRVKK